MVEWYIIHVHEGKEEKVAGILKDKLPSALYRAFVPQREKYFRRTGVTKIERSVCFPNYVFIESHAPSSAFKGAAFGLLYSIKEVYSILKYDGKDDITLQENEREFLQRLLGTDDCIRVSSGDIIDGKLKIASGALMGMENAVKKIDRHKMTAELEITIMGKTQRMPVPLEIKTKS